MIKNNPNLEALRGYSAIFVVFFHLETINNKFNPTYYPHLLSNFNFPGHLSVLVFFVLSGYVIGISNNTEFDFQKSWLYIKKRLIRIYPIYFVCVAFALLTSSIYHGHFTVFTHLVFLQGPVNYIVEEISPIWSLNYEMLYYLLFIPIAMYNIDLYLVLALCIIIGISNYYLYPRINTPIISSYMFGFCFWILGLLISKVFNQKVSKTNYLILVSNLFLMCSLVKLNANFVYFNGVFIHFLNTNFNFPRNLYYPLTIIPFLDFAFLPYAFLFVINFAGIDFRFKKYFQCLLQFAPLLTLFSFKITYETYPTLAFAITLYCISTFLFFTNYKLVEIISGHIIRLGVWLGGISYALYVIHVPILFIFGKVLTSSTLGFTLKILIYLVITIYCSYFLDKKFHPWIKKYFILSAT